MRGIAFCEHAEHEEDESAHTRPDLGRALVQLLEEQADHRGGRQRVLEAR